MLKNHGPPAAVLAGLTLIWEAACRGLDIPAFILPPPSRIALALWEWHRELLLIHLPVTLLEAVLGLAASVALGSLVALALHLSPVLHRTLYPLVVASQAIPIIAISPVFLFWFGYSLAQKVAVVVLISFFPVAVNACDGLRSTDPDLREWLQAAGATRWRILWMAEIPSALPAFFTGVKVAAAVSVIGAVLGEWLGGQAGLGVFGRRAASSLKTPELFGSVVILSALGVAMFLLAAWAERRVLAHRAARQPEEADR